MKTTRALVIMVFALYLTAEVARADFTFGEPINLGSTVNSTYNDAGSNISPDGLSHYFMSDQPGGSGDYDIYVMRRPTPDGDWNPPVNLGSPVNSSAWESCPSVSADGLSLFFESNRPGGVGDQDIWVSSRPTPDSDWGQPENLGSTVNSSVWDSCPSVSSDGLSLYFCSYRTGGSGSCDLWVVTRATVSDQWGQPVNLGSRVNSSDWEYHPGISADGLKLFFHSNRPGGSGDDDIWVTSRASTDDDWGDPVNLGSKVNSSFRDIAPDTSSDGFTLYFTSTRTGGLGNMDIYQAQIIPTADFDGNGICDFNDLVIVIENWETSESLCDIGPMPWGDGIVNRADLEILMDYYDQVVDVAAYWKLDETEGLIAYDSSGHYHDANVIGDPNWRPEDGMFDGALELDGINDYISTPFVLSPNSGLFSVFAWIKGGAPGQVILSQADGVNWLSADPLDGCLMTELRSIGGRTETTPLLSQSLITDGNWHHIGFVWDGVNRILYVDDFEVASDTQSHLTGSEGGLYIGTGNNMETGTFWKGLIDDVRIYDRVVTP